MTNKTPADGLQEAEVMKLWREVGLPEYFLGNGGTNRELVAFARLLSAKPDEDFIYSMTRVIAIAKAYRADETAGVNYKNANIRNREVIERAIELLDQYKARHAAPAGEAEPKRHKWRDERCVDCGQKDWMAGTVCTPAPAESELPIDTVFGFIARITECGKLNHALFNAVLAVRETCHAHLSRQAAGEGEWLHGMAFRYIGEMHKEELSGSIHYFVGFDPTMNARNPVFVRKPNNGTAHLHWHGHCLDYVRAPEHDKTARTHLERQAAGEGVEELQKEIHELKCIINDSKDAYALAKCRSMAKVSIATNENLLAKIKELEARTQGAAVDVGVYNRRECFADSADGLNASIHYDEILKELKEALFCFEQIKEALEAAGDKSALGKSIRLTCEGRIAAIKHHLPAPSSEKGKCQYCDGSGCTVEVRPACWGKNEDGSCHGDCAIPEQYQEQCSGCGGYGKHPIEREGRL